MVILSVSTHVLPFYLGDVCMRGDFFFGGGELGALLLAASTHTASISAKGCTNAGHRRRRRRYHYDHDHYQHDNHSTLYGM